MAEVSLFPNSPSWGLDPFDNEAFNDGQTLVRPSGGGGQTPKKKTPSEIINEQNPNADPSKPYVQAGDTGGYLDGVGVTVGQGSSITPAQAQAHIAAAKAYGLSDAQINSFLAANPNDTHRLIEAFADDGKPKGSGGGGGGGGGLGKGSSGLPGNQFDDQYTSMLESIAKSQMGQVKSNPALDQLMAFLQKRFTDLSTNPGYSPAEQAMLNTQAFEPIEALRRQSQQNELQRTSRAGYLPTSGITNQNQIDIDRSADQMRTVANRDLAINAIGRRNQDLNQALDIGRLQALTIPAGQRSEELALANLLYQLPRTAMFDALSVINGSPNSSDAFNQALQLAQQAQINQQQNQQNDQALWSGIGYWLDRLMKGGQLA